MTQTASQSRLTGALALWFGLLAAPLAWTLHLFISYGLVPVTCDRGSKLLLGVVTGAAAIISVAAAWVSWRIWQRTRMDSTTELGGVRGRDAFLGLAGAALSLLFLALILVEGIPDIFLDPCR